LGFQVPDFLKACWAHIVAARKKRDNLKNSLRACAWQKQLKHIAVAETGATSLFSTFISDVLHPVVMICGLRNE
jgi:hypothetical protein